MNPRAQRRASRVIAIALGIRFAVSAMPAAAAIPRSEREGLIALYNATNGPAWHHQEHWNGPPGTECVWHGILCNDDGTHVIWIQLGSNSLSGQLPSLTALTELELFDAYFNNLSGPLPSFSGMRHLEGINVFANQLTSPIPTFTDLEALTFIDLEYNQLTGTIPEFDVPTLESIELGGNHFTGTLPPLARYPNLSSFTAFLNELTGPIPSLTEFPKLRSFIVSSNHLSGHLPPAPTQATPGIFSVCPNDLDPDPDPAWDRLIGNTPWYSGCSGRHLNLDQFGIGGTWYESSLSGQGFVLSAMPDINGPGHGILFGGWFTFTPRIDPAPTSPHWFSLQGEVGTESGETDLGLYETLGGNFDAPPQPTTRRVGTVHLSLNDCVHGELGYHFDDQRVRDGSFPIERLTANANCTFDGDAPPPTDNSRLSGSWYDPEHSGQGLIVDLVPEQHTLFAAWYTFARQPNSFDPAEAQRWYYMQAADVAADATSMSGVPIYARTQGVFVGPVEGDEIVGTADFEFDGCGALTVTYAFNASGPEGMLHLKRLGLAPEGCR